MLNNTFGDPTDDGVDCNAVTKGILIANAFANPLLTDLNVDMVKS